MGLWSWNTFLASLWLYIQLIDLRINTVEKNVAYCNCKTYGRGADTCGLSRTYKKCIINWTKCNILCWRHKRWNANKVATSFSERTNEQFDPKEYTAKALTWLKPVVGLTFIRVYFYKILLFVLSKKCNLLCSRTVENHVGQTVNWQGRHNHHIHMFRGIFVQVESAVLHQWSDFHLSHLLLLKAVCTMAIAHKHKQCWLALLNFFTKTGYWLTSTAYAREQWPLCKLPSKDEMDGDQIIGADSTWTNIPQTWIWWLCLVFCRVLGKFLLSVSNDRVYREQRSRHRNTLGK